MRGRVLIVGLVILAVVGGVAAVRGTGRAQSQAAPAATPPQASVPVTAAVARRADLVRTVAATGTVASLREAKIAAKLPGSVAAVLVREGQRVLAGAPLMRLETSQVATQAWQARAGADLARARLAQLLAGARSQERAQASNAVAQAKAALDQAQSDAQRMRALLQMGAIARQQLDAAETQFRVAQAAYNTALQQQSLVIEGPRTEDIQAARAQLAQAEALLASTLIQMRDATVTAPFAGTIVRRAVEPGESVSPLAPSFVLAQLDDVYIELLVPERHRAALRAGQRADVRVDALPGRQFTGKVAEISPAASAVSRSFVVKVRVANPDRVLQPGMFARATIVTGTRSGVLQIPERAVLATAGGPVIFIVQGGRAVRRAVTLGDRQGGLLEIRSGVSAGESVVVGGQEGLTDNQAVAPRPPQP